MQYFFISQKFEVHMTFLNHSFTSYSLWNFWELNTNLEFSLVTILWLFTSYFDRQVLELHFQYPFPSRHTACFYVYKTSLRRRRCRIDVLYMLKRRRVSSGLELLKISSLIHFMPLIFLYTTWKFLVSDVSREYNKMSAAGCGLR